MLCRGSLSDHSVRTHESQKLLSGDFLWLLHTCTFEVALWIKSSEYIFHRKKVSSPLQGNNSIWTLKEKENESEYPPILFIVFKIVKQWGNSAFQWRSDSETNAKIEWLQWNIIECMRKIGNQLNSHGNYDPETLIKHCWPLWRGNCIQTQFELSGVFSLHLLLIIWINWVMWKKKLMIL